MKLSVIIPALNEGPEIVATLEGVQSLRARGPEVIVADGGSDDATRECAGQLADRVIAAPTCATRSPKWPSARS